VEKLDLQLQLSDYALCSKYPLASSYNLSGYSLLVSERDLSCLFVRTKFDASRELFVVKTFLGLSFALIQWIMNELVDYFSSLVTIASTS